MERSALYAAVFPFLRWRREVNRRTLRGDLLAGLTGAVIVLPQGVATSISWSMKGRWMLATTSWN